MRVLLRNARIGLYYAGRKHWVGKADAAADLITIEHATELSADENFDQMEILVDYDDSACELVLPVKSRGPQREAAGASETVWSKTAGDPAEVVADDRQLDGVTELAGAAQQGAPKEPPVIVAAMVPDPQEPERLQERLKIRA